MYAYLSFVVPILTFLLGAALTLFLKRHDKRTANLALYARELSDCANEWYNQLYEIQIDGRYNKPKKIDRMIEFYERNRLILPRYLRALEVLKKYQEAEVVVAEAEQILRLLTTADAKLSPGARKICRSALDILDGDRMFLPKRTVVAANSERTDNSVLEDLNIRQEPSLQNKSYSELFAVLDDHVQRMNTEAGKII